ncbi:3-beta-hydroxysteroid sulfotransferase-like [Dipodomys merriami]|uniref:3-beta-hydroxysteroid sulfotransferase-like n=1 Tax=Dipodomys merriami TaxID=94247 RepID=UPI003855FDF9
MAHNYLWYQGIPFPAVGYNPQVIKAAHEKLVLKDEDVPQISKGDPEWIWSEPFWDGSPWMETEHGSKIIKDKKEGPPSSPPTSPCNSSPKSFFTSKAKVIYIIRNPKDVLVSGYHFWGGSKYMKNPQSLQQYYGSSKAVGWMSMREKGNMLELSYEVLKKDTRSTVEKICQFLGKKLDPEELDLFLENSSFHAMKENTMSNYSMANKNNFPVGIIMTRKGIVGDWKNHFTVTQAEDFDKILWEKMAGFPPALFPWD